MAIIGALVGLVLLVSLFWNIKLQREINTRKVVQQELEVTNSKFDRANKDLLIANEELKKMSMVDGLTGISNRRYFDSFLEKVWAINLRERFPLALIMIDIDKFKVFNDTHGHLAGDQCLIDVARVIDNTVQRSGDFVARYGGEEFAVILSNTDEVGAAALAEKIRRAVEEMLLNIEGQDLNITVSLGVAAIQTNENIGPEDLIHAADTALYQAKRTGRNRVKIAKA